MTDTRQVQELVGESDLFLATLEQASRVAPLERPVLIIGERGTGKELIAERLHYLSGRWQKPLIKLNCAALNENLLESELFGHEAGAFTGARGRHRGRFERADGGTLFLDELANTPAAVQEKLLRVLEYGEFERVGGDEAVRVDVRLIAATNEDLPSLARAGRFRADLLDRLAFEVVTLPPLRHRPEDVLALADHFAMRMTKTLGRPLFSGFSDHARATLLGHDWPGNVRELKNTIERSLYRMLDGSEPLHQVVLDPFASPYRPQQVEDALAIAASTKTSTTLTTASNIQLPLSLKDELAQREQEILRYALRAAQYNQRRAAEQLGLTYHQLRGILKKYDLLGEGD
ncbi:MAG: phage shock protein operon transcriptional activator [Gammaproteobacteria bacterium]|nr:phage shock protein operon transcriptional activator [Gammaproteobacteria bacterium]